MTVTKRVTADASGGQTNRITAIPLGGQTSRVTATAVGGQTTRVAAAAAGGQTNRVTHQIDSETNLLLYEDGFNLLLDGDSQANGNISPDGLELEGGAADAYSFHTKRVPTV